MYIAIPEDSIIPNLPNLLGCNNHHFHEKWCVLLLRGMG
jgi:hypothetical protein